MRVLIVDRVWGQRQKVRSWLVQGGYSAPNILEADGGESALELLKGLDFAVDVVICDWADPRVDGASLAAQVRNLAGAGVDFIAVGDFDATQRAAALRNGAADAIGRPIRPELLLGKLVALEKKRASERRIDPSQTGRFRLMAGDSQAFKPAPLVPAVWEALRRGARHHEVASGRPVPAGAPGARLCWVERGAVAVRETREDDVVVSFEAATEQFIGETSFSGGKVLALEATAVEDSWVASLEPDQVRRLIAEQALLFYYLRNISNTRARLSSPAGVSAEKGLSGALDSLRILDLLQVLHGARRTGVLRLDGSGATSYLQFVDGQVVHAESGGQKGESAVLEVMALRRGQFEFYVGPEMPGMRTVKTDMVKLLMMGATAAEPVR